MAQTQPQYEFNSPGRYAGTALTLTPFATETQGNAHAYQDAVTGSRGSYQTDPNRSNFQQLNVDLSNDVRNPGLWASGGPGGVGAMWRGVKGYNALKNAREDQREMERQWGEMVARETAMGPGKEFLRTHGGGSTARMAEQRPMSAEELQLAYNQEMQNNARQQMQAQIDAYFSDPTRAAQLEQMIQQEQGALSGNVQEATRRGTVSAAQQSARQGLMGGSTDIERRMNVQRQGQESLTDIYNQGVQARQAQKAQDIGNRTSLSQLVQTSDPFAQQAAGGYLQQLQASGQGLSGMNAAQESYSNADALGQKMTSQALGSGASVLAGGLKNYYANKYAR